jgi:soluble lytic murein transglycosylase
LEIKNNKVYLIRPDKWWKERSIIARSLIYKKKYELAYKITSNHAMIEGPEFAEAEWLSGWIALVFLDDPILAVGHFKNFYNNVGYPISISRGAYWLARAYKKLKNNKSSTEWYSIAAKYLNTYYGQLAYMKLFPNEEYTLVEQVVPRMDQKKKFYRNELTKIVVLLHELNKDEYAKDFLKHLANYNVSENSETLAANLSTEIGRYDFAIQISKTASYEKRFINDYNFPIISTPVKINNKKMPNQEIILAIIRQESEFDSEANSSAGAKGMMQLMTYTAKLVSKQAKLSYSKSKLTKNPDYNIHLGSYYFATLLEEFDGSYPFAIAGYNAGPKRVRYWKKINKNPQKNQIDYVNWIELIKFKETRNYVQRVLENVNVYNYMVSKKPVKMINFFKDYPSF